MRKALVPILSLTVVALAVTVGFAMREVSDTGDWPKSWPAELEPLRSQSRTLSHSNYTMYHIPFTDRAKFEAAWPHILSVATENTSLELSRGHDRMTAVDFDAGVVIIAPNTGKLFYKKNNGRYSPCAESNIPDQKFLRVGPPWPDEIRDESGKLPDRVVPDGLKWRPATAQEMKDFPPIMHRSQRVRTEVRLIVDGKVVDLNRIQLPASVIDKRFEKKPNR